MPSREYYQPTRRLVSQDDQSITQRATVPRSRFQNAWTRKTAFNAGLLVPFLIEEILPGDHVNYNVHAFVRMSTPLFPILDNQSIDTFFFFVPARLLWEHFVNFMGEQKAPTDTIDYTIPTIVLDDNVSTVGSIYDHFGIPTTGQLEPAAGGGLLTVNSLPFRAYNLIFNEWFRDQNVQAPAAIFTTDAGDDSDDYQLLRRNKKHDYFTSALPWTQKFDGINIPLGGLAPVQGIGVNNAGNPTAGPAGFRETDGTIRTYDAYDFTDASATNLAVKFDGLGSNAAPQIYADLALATGVAINAFRQAFLVQQLLELDARGGTRYVELILAHYGVRNPDYRLQRPEYIGGGQTPLTVTPVAQTAPTASLTVGALGAAGTAAGTHRASYAATEHGYIIGLINVRSELSYQQGLHKLWSRSTKFDLYWPSLAGLGEQAILRKEIYAKGLTAVDDLVFGYQERWQEYRTRVNEVTGIMRSTAAATLDAWHLAQKFITPPVLSTGFLQDIPPVVRILAAGQNAEDFNMEYIADILYERTIVRAIPTYGTPVTLGRF